MDIHLILWAGNALGLIVFGFAKYFLKPKSFRILTSTALLLYLSAVMYITIFSRRPVLETRWNLIPLQSYATIQVFYFSLLPNALLFIPIGLLLNGVFPHHKTLYIIAIGMGISLCIELIQLFLHVGICDIDDFLSNSAGCILGALAGKGTVKLVKGKTPEPSH